MRSHAAIEIETENDAFTNGVGFELARILRQLADRVEYVCEETSVPLHDINGNKVGEFNHCPGE